MWEAIDQSINAVHSCASQRAPQLHYSLLVCSLCVTAELTAWPAGEATSASPYRYDVPVEQLVTYFFQHHAHDDHGFQNLFLVRLVARPLCCGTRFCVLAFVIILTWYT